MHKDGGCARRVRGRGWTFWRAAILLACCVGVGCVLLQGQLALVLAAAPVLLAAGDIADCDSTRDSDTANLLDTLPGTVATLGDSVYERGSPAEFEECYEPTWGRHLTRTHPAPGNHEYETGGAAGYYTYFGAAASPLDSPCEAGCQGYYSYNLGAWHIVVLNSETATGAGSAQEQWLRSDLAANPAACTLAYWHTPRFSSGSKLVSSKSEALWRTLYEYGADVVLNGHEHFYERFAPQRPDGEADAAHGIRQFIVGTGGRTLRGFAAIHPNSEVRNGATWGVLQLTLHANSYDWAFVPIAGQTFGDTGSAACVSPAGAPPPPPSATAIQTPEQTETETPTQTPTQPVTNTPTATSSPTNAPSPTPTATATPLPSNTPAPTPTPTNSPTLTPPATDTPSSTPTPQTPPARGEDSRQFLPLVFKYLSEP